METTGTTPFASTFSLAGLCVDHGVGRAAVLGATIAFGSCALVGCGDDADHASKPPVLSAAAALSQDDEVEREEEPPTLSVDAEEGRVGTFDASPGFTPDPMTHPGTTAGGPIDASHEDERCHGWLAPEPDYVITADRAFAELALMVGSSEDTTLYVLGPDHEARCADDEEGHDPVIRGAFDPGVYRVWVGTRTPGREAPYVLALSELDDTAPSQLAH